MAKLNYAQRIKQRWEGIIPPDMLDAQVRWEISAAAKRWYFVPKSWTWAKRPSLRQIALKLNMPELQVAKIVLTPMKIRSPAERFFNEKFNWSWMAMLMVAQQKQRTRFVHWRGDDNGP